MFNIFDNENQLSINNFSPEAMSAIPMLKVEAFNMLLAFGELLSNPKLTPEQKHFMENGRECYKNVLENGYSFLILALLVRQLPSKIANRFPCTSAIENDTDFFRFHNHMVFTAYEMMNATIRELTDRGILAWFGNRGKPLLENGMEFFHDGFYYNHADNTSALMEWYADRCEYYMENALREFERSGLLREQQMYYNFERNTMIIGLKEHFRTSFYRFLADRKAQDDVFPIAETMKENSFKRTELVLDMVKELTEHGIISA